MKSRISISQFKAQCLEIVAGLQTSGKTLIVTKRDKPVIKVSPILNEEKKSLFGMLQNKAKINSDIIKPIEEAWDAEQD
jgi:antitoxin (DNA-binding transcriptional repressor) of toxin-antitoxin stability system